MRLWHIDLIDVLPRQQLLGQWRELNSIFKKQDKHILINYVYEYPEYELYRYSIKVLAEMSIRNYKYCLDNMISYFQNTETYMHNQFLLQDTYAGIIDLADGYTYMKKPFHKHHNKEYLTICYYNLKEKYLCGGITEDEWKEIDEKYKRLVKDGN